MTYELAKKLKEAGYPKLKFFVDWNQHELHPSLEELIEACGDRFGSLGCNYEDMPKSWGASEYHPINKPSQVFSMGCATPEEAVANLWLALNQKSGNKEK